MSSLAPRMSGLARFFAIGAFAVLLFGGLGTGLASSAFARPGGGGGFSGGGSSGGGSSGGWSGGGSSSGWSSGGGSGYGYSGGSGTSPTPSGPRALGEAVVLFAFVAFLIFVIRLTQAHSRLNRNPDAWVATSNQSGRASSGRRQLSSIRDIDPDFSAVLFEDFLYALYTRVHQLRASGSAAALGAYVRAEARASIQGTSELSSVTNIVIGAMSPTNVAVFGYESEVTVDFETNYTELSRAGTEQNWYARERWTLIRKNGVLSRPPDKTSTFGCPSCGAPTAETDASGACAYCGKPVTDGQFDWVVKSIEAERTPIAPHLTSDGEERGTYLPTVIDSAADAHLQALVQRDPSFTIDAFQNRVAMIHREMNLAWSELTWEKARAFLSDRFFSAQQYWIDSYKRSGLRNRTDGARVNRIELAAVTSDKWFDAITVRLHATGLDYTMSSDGRVVSGSTTKQREFTEYWTLIRSHNAKGAAVATVTCPKCGAPMAINMAGMCEHCGAKVNSGEFDWVLSRIEQDETYFG